MVDRLAPGLCLRPLFHGTLPLLALLIRSLRRRSRSSTAASVCDASTTAALLRCASLAAPFSASGMESVCTGCALGPWTIPWLTAGRRLMRRRMAWRGLMAQPPGGIHVGARSWLCIVHIVRAGLGSSVAVKHLLRLAGKRGVVDHALTRLSTSRHYNDKVVFGVHSKALKTTLHTTKWPIMPCTHVQPMA